MRITINGRQYNPDTARLVGRTYLSGKNEQDSSRICMELHQKRTGEYFIFLTGSQGSVYCRAPVITPLTFDEAKTWAQQNLSPYEYSAEFVQNEEKKGVKRNKVITSVSLSPQAAAYAKTLASKRKVSISELIETLLLDAADQSEEN